METIVIATWAASVSPMIHGSQPPVFLRFPIDRTPVGFSVEADKRRRTGGSSSWNSETIAVLGMGHKALWAEP